MTKRRVFSSVGTPLPPITAEMLSPQSDQDFFALARWVRQRYSTCLKTQTGALIVDKDVQVVSLGANMCCPQGQLYGLPVLECPRMKIVTGARYDLCKPIHAEIVAVINAFGVSPVEQRHLWHFPDFTLRLKKYEGSLVGATLYMVGHYWFCQECKDFSKLLGIENLKFDNLSGGETLSRYQQSKLTGQEKGALDVSGCILGGVVTVRISPQEISEFCIRNKIKRGMVVPFLPHLKIGAQDVFLIEVPPGSEIDSAKRFGKDSAVREARVVSLANPS